VAFSLNAGSVRDTFGGVMYDDDDAVVVVVAAAVVVVVVVLVVAAVAGAAIISFIICVDGEGICTVFVDMMGSAW
jgi:hypothetical protein